MGALGALLVVLLAGCEPVSPCDDYVDYMCSCHDADTGASCEDLQDTYAGADPDVQDECSVLLGEQEDEDQANGETCSG